MDSSYGKSARYLGDAGEEYFAWQRTSGDTEGRINARSFQQYIEERDSVLDFGCGGGFLLKNIRCARRLGVEINPMAREVARENGTECYASLSELTDVQVDVAISNHALEHVPYPTQALSELRHILKPDGTLVLKLPIDDWRVQQKINPDDINHHLYTWTPQLLFNCLQEAGFDKSQINIGVITHAWFPGAIQVYQRYLIPEVIFDFGCRLFAALKRRRQLFAVAGNHRHGLARLRLRCPTGPPVAWCAVTALGLTPGLVSVVATAQGPTTMPAKKLR
jgi:SAM-dependent methyltransferase